MLAFGRAYKLIIGIPYEVTFGKRNDYVTKVEPLEQFYQNLPDNSYVLTDHHIKFHIRKANTKNTQTSTITVSNLPDEVVDYLRENVSKKPFLRLEAGYGDDLKDIFVGVVNDFEDDFSRETRMTTLYVGEGTVNKTEASTSRVYPRGTSINKVVDDLIRDLGLPKGQVVQVDGKDLPLARSYHGNVAEILQNLAEDLGYNFSIQNSEVYMVPRDSRLFTSEEVALLNASSGLIGVPKPYSDKQGKADRNNRDSKDKLEVTCLLDGAIIPETSIYVESIDIDGAYKVSEVEFIGDSRGNDWFNRIKCEKVNKTIRR